MKDFSVLSGRDEPSDEHSKPTVDLKKGIIARDARIRELAAEISRVRAYAFDYGNATGECAAGYLQKKGLICHKCSADDYRDGCPIAKATESPADARDRRGSERSSHVARHNPTQENDHG